MKSGEPTRVSPTAAATPTTVGCDDDGNDRLVYLPKTVCLSICPSVRLLLSPKARPAGEKTIVFLSTCASVDFFGKALSQLKVVKDLLLRVETLHGRMVQKRRTAVRVHLTVPLTVPLLLLLFLL